eukprot:gene174-2362_t
MTTPSWIESLVEHQWSVATAGLVLHVLIVAMIMVYFCTRPKTRYTEFGDLDVKALRKGGNKVE